MSLDKPDRAPNTGVDPSKIDYKNLTPDQATSLATCNRSGHCCMYGSGYVLKEEIPRIAEKMGITPEEFKKKYLDDTPFPTAMRLKMDKQERPYGPCVLLDQESKACTIHAFKPLHCRIGTCNEHGIKLSNWYFEKYLKHDDIQKFGVVINNGRQDKHEHQ